MTDCNVGLIFNWRYNWLIVPQIVPQIDVKPVHSCMSYEGEIYQKDDRRGYESRSGDGAFGMQKSVTKSVFLRILNRSYCT